MLIFLQKLPKNISKIFFIGMFVTVGIFGYAPPAHASMWGLVDIFGDLIQNMMERMQRQIEGAVIGSLKMAAVQMLNQQVGQLIGGGAAGQARFITNYNDFLYQGPAQRTELYMNDFFTLTTRGKGSSANYISAGSGGGNYVGYLESVGRKATVESGAPCTVDLGESANSETMFEEGDFRGFNAFVSNPCNNPYGYALEAEDAYQGELMRQQQVAAIKAASSGGFLPGEENGNVITPAGAIEAMTTNIQKLPMDIIANASNPAELLSGVVSAMATKVVTNLVQNGIGQVQSNIQREIGGVNTQVNAARNQATGQLGPAAPFTQSVIQRSVRVNSSTPPIPDNGTGGP